jgi:magnesium-transporting ATPase (P-type)
VKIIEHAHSLKVEEILEILDTSYDGLSQDKITKRQMEFGKNLLKEHKVSTLSILLEQFKSPLVLILLLAAAISFLLGSFGDALLIFLIVCINTVLGFWQELKALTSIEALNKMTESKITLMRAGNNYCIITDCTWRYRTAT